MKIWGLLVVELPADILLDLVFDDSELVLAPALEELAVPDHVGEAVDVKLIGICHAVIVDPSLHRLLHLLQRSKDLNELVDGLAMADIRDLLLALLPLFPSETTWRF